MDLSAPEPLPKEGDSPPIWDLVIRDMRDRDKFGRAKYGVPLKARDGRNTIVDAYQEILDAAVYLRKLIYEQEGK